jgi:endonuclease/exonuclease/phosphatase family metal-dependent hydrolase
MMYLNQAEHTDEGLSIFSLWPIVETSWTALSRDRDDREDDHQRIVLRACIQSPRGAKINFFVTHLSLSLSARRRSAVEVYPFHCENSLHC